MGVYDEPVGNADKSGARRKASRPWCFAKVAPSRLRRRRKYPFPIYTFYMFYTAKKFFADFADFVAKPIATA